MKQITFHIVDVFAEEKYQGNQLAVFENTGILSEEKMLQIAREINFQETTFIISDEKKNGGFDVRIFTPEYEVPFAGHPTLGTAYILAKKTLQDKITLNLKVGQVPVIREADSLWLKISNPFFGKQFDTSIASILGLEQSVLDQNMPIQLVSTGLPYLIIAVRNLEAIKQVKFQEETVKNWLIKHQLFKTNATDGLTTAFFLYTRETESTDNQLHARMFCYENDKVVEDAATGSANACLLAYLLQYESDKINYRVEQGYEMNRPSLIRIRGEINAQNDFNLEVGGKVKVVAEGKWFV
ncbi:phenazine biosynthesis protein PhzF family [Emticicia oligotrophica DSM 17448]|uniref:Phenazine biosynthesis protein PhzF family n=1 Tax=Emticicia oligotrophica (strain DSM 17448 / CIP 109782 / MTCC 6937 / GPTSA100-15) TaxID=929562 RepID=A0ABN4AK05_EMTOG|nr:PhzF family phenazine biosynthesis protein [Emticicia oligotrophica]AFK02412.1 phenazine biosynthesis protein PhzF family [Emticicia oligotrophica DSM 17448]